uniref:Alternative protein NTN4 n=1 Tax=Homo sapiens TaxID=9606 RepID=L8ECJ3_HUMAN|nr:alternative protein NTN4 [Homo sapiens]
MQSMISLSRAAASAMATLINAYLFMASDLSRPQEHSTWSMGSVCVSTTQQAATASTVPRYTMTGHGRQLMAKRGLPTSAEPASVMGMLIPVTSTLMCGRHQGIVVVVSVMTVSTTQKDSIARGASQASIVTCGDPSQLQMLANRVPAIQ